MLGLAGLLGLLMIGASADIGDAISKPPENDDGDDEFREDSDRMYNANATLEGGEGADLLETMFGNDVVYGAQGDDSVHSGAGDDLVDGSGGDDSINGEAGDDSLIGELGSDTLTGGEGDDDLRGAAGSDDLRGSAGNDTLIGGEGDDTLTGGRDDDELMGGFDDDIVIGGAGADVVNGNDGNDTLIGGRITSDGGFEDDQMRDYLNGSDGDDTLVLGAADNGHGGDGDDSFVVGDWIDVTGPATIEDFDGTQDELVVVYDDSLHSEPDVTVDEDPDSPGDIIVSMDGVTLATVVAPQGWDASQVSVVAASALPMPLVA